MGYSRKIESDDGYHQQEQPKGREGVESNLTRSCNSDHLSIPKNAPRTFCHRVHSIRIDTASGTTHLESTGFAGREG